MNQIHTNPRVVVTLIIPAEDRRSGYSFDWASGGIRRDCSYFGINRRSICNLA